MLFVMNGRQLHLQLNMYSFPHLNVLSAKVKAAVIRFVTSRVVSCARSITALIQYELREEKQVPCTHVL
jgi:hypothetical protein